jgi:TRAP-type C4-dicarboxylate transport system permease small subunit
MGTMTVGVILLVLLRYIFNITFVWAEATITIMFIGTTYFGAVLGVQEDGHIRISYFVERFPKRIQKIIHSVVMVIIIAVQVVVFKTSLVWIDKIGNTRNVALNIPKAYFYLMVPISSALIIFYALTKIVSYVFNINDTVPGENTERIR